MICQYFPCRTDPLAVLSQDMARVKSRRFSLASAFSLCFQCTTGSSWVLRRPIETTALIRRRITREILPRIFSGLLILTILLASQSGRLKAVCSNTDRRELLLPGRHYPTVTGRL